MASISVQIQRGETDMSNHKSKSLPHSKASSIDNELPEVNADAGIEGVDKEFSGTDIPGSEQLIRAGMAGGDSELEDKIHQQRPSVEGRQKPSKTPHNASPPQP